MLRGASRGEFSAEPRPDRMEPLSSGWWRQRGLGACKFWAWALRAWGCVRLRVPTQLRPALSTFKREVKCLTVPKKIECLASSVHQNAESIEKTQMISNSLAELGGDA